MRNTRLATGPKLSDSLSPPVSPADAGYDPGFGIYVHWPFCQSLCPYCDFNSHVRARVEENRWAAAYVTELAHYAGRSADRLVTSVFLGGGTPSLMAPRTVQAVLSAIRRYWPVADNVEITIEANPSSTEAGRFQGYRQAGVNRVSLGVQALHDADLRFLGRKHSPDESLAAIEIAGDVFDRFSIDLIYGRPGQTAALWRRELADATSLANGHLSAYQLTIEPGTVFHGAMRRGEFRMPDEATLAELYETTQQVLAMADLPAYEISSHARTGQACRHNLTYWRYGDFVGVGPGAHGRLTMSGGQIHATRQHRAPEIWLEQVETDGHAGRWDRLDNNTVRDELLMVGLRLTDGVSRTAVRARLGQEIEECLPTSSIKRLVDGGFLELDTHGMRATATGRQRLDAVLGDLLA